MELEPLKLKRHETFSIRDGWLEKGINIVSNNPFCLKKEDGPKFFGVGSNMCKSLKYWLSACNICEFSVHSGATLTEFGNLLLKYDPFLDDIFSWWMIHYFLVKNKKDAPIINLFFNMDYNRFEKEEIFQKIKDKLEQIYESISLSSLDSDVSILLKSYYSDDLSNPENNLNCPLGKLHLLEMYDKKTYQKCNPSFDELDYRIVYYAIVSLYKEKREKLVFNLEDLFSEQNNPLKIFNLTKSTLLLYLEEMKKNGLIKLIKTAGLNTVTIDEVKSLEELITSYYKED